MVSAGMTHYGTCYYVLQQFTRNTRKGYGSVVVRIVFGAFLENRRNIASLNFQSCGISPH